MSILETIKSAIQKKRFTTEVTFETFALFPLFNMLSEKEPFNDWYPSSTKIPEGFEDRFKMYVWMYQMYTHYMLTSIRFGYDIADKALHMQVERFNNGSESLAGNYLEQTIRQIHNSVTKQSENPYVMETGDQKVVMPFEYIIALEFLVRGNDALFPIDLNSVQAGELPELNGADFALTECLVHGRESAHKYFEPLIKHVKVTL